MMDNFFYNILVFFYCLFCWFIVILFLKNENIFEEGNVYNLFFKIVWIRVFENLKFFDFRKYSIYIVI